MRRALAAAALALLAAACSSAPASAPDQIGDWSKHGGQAHLQAILDDNQAIGGDTGNNAAFTADCTRLRDHVQAARAYKPVPDSEAQRHWAAALDDAAASAQACLTAAGGNSSDGWSQAAASATAAQTELKAMIDRIAAINSGSQQSDS
jgi:hypothetical protein